jgi:hypothetical protein
MPCQPRLSQTLFLKLPCLRFEGKVKGTRPNNKGELYLTPRDSRVTKRNSETSHIIFNIENSVKSKYLENNN